MKCKESIYGLENFKVHICAIVHKIKPTLEFDWIVPQSGLLHWEMNSAKSFFKLNWDVFMKIIGHTLNQTPKIPIISTFKK